MTGFLRQKLSGIIIFMAAAFCPAGAPAQGLGPFHLPAVGFSEMFRETPMFISPYDHQEGRVQFNMAMRWFNVWTYHIQPQEGYDGDEYDWGTHPEDFPFGHGSFLLDMETVSFNPRISVKLNEKIQVDATVPVIYQCGGILDGFVEGFHDTFGIDQHNRDKWERNGTAMLYVSPTGRIIDSSRQIPGTFLGNIVVGGSYRLRHAAPALGLRLLCKFPTSTMDDGWKQNGIDATLQAALAWNNGQFNGYHGAGVTVYGSDGIDELELKKLRFSLLNAIEYMISPTLSLLAHLVAASPTADYPELDKPIVELTLGFKKRMGRGMLEFGLIENLFFYDNSPDMGVHVAYTFSAF